MTSTVCPVCRLQARVRNDGKFARHTRGSIGAYCPGSERDAALPLALDALRSAEANLYVAERDCDLCERAHDAERAIILARHAQELAEHDARPVEARTRVDQSRAQVEALTLAALSAAGFEPVETDHGRAWREIARPERLLIPTVEAMRLARKDAGR